MGELADRMERFGVASNPHPTQGDAMRWHNERWEIKDAIAALEQRVVELEQQTEAQFTGAVAPLTNARGLDLTVENLLEAQRRLGDNPTLSDRLTAAEKRAEQAWAAVTELVQRPASEGEYACVGVHQGSPERIRKWDKPSEHIVAAHAASGEPPEALERYAYQTDFAYKPQICITVVYAVNAPANPELLERASVELAEAYQRAKAEAEAAAAAAAEAKDNEAFRATPKDPKSDAVTFTMRTWR